MAQLETRLSRVTAATSRKRCDSRNLMRACSGPLHMRGVHCRLWALANS